MSDDIKSKLMFPCLLMMVVIGIAVLIIKQPAAQQLSFETAQIEIKGRIYDLEIAASAQQRQQGLMHRKRLPEQSAMLFVYPRSGNHRIWMKNTLIPLTVVWFDENETVIHRQGLLPCKADPCPSYGSDTPSRYIIEFHADLQDLNPGERLPGIRKLVK